MLPVNTYLEIVYLLPVGSCQSNIIYIQMTNHLNFNVAGNRMGAKYGKVLSFRGLIGSNTFTFFAKHIAFGNLQR